MFLLWSWINRWKYFLWILRWLLLLGFYKLMDPRNLSVSFLQHRFEWAPVQRTKFPFNCSILVKPGEMIKQNDVRFVFVRCHWDYVAKNQNLSNKSSTCSNEFSGYPIRSLRGTLGKLLYKWMQVCVLWLNQYLRPLEIGENGLCETGLLRSSWWSVVVRSATPGRTFRGWKMGWRRISNWSYGIMHNQLFELIFI